jgi:hypothetical protein
MPIPIRIAMAPRTATLFAMIRGGSRLINPYTNQLATEMNPKVKPAAKHRERSQTQIFCRLERKYRPLGTFMYDRCGAVY